MVRRRSTRGGLGGVGLAGLLIIVGLILFIFPEPATSGLGVILMLIGVLLWLL
jgi:hypothetical protein